MERPVLLRFPEKTGGILGCSFLVSILIGFITAVITSQWFTRHAKLMELPGIPFGAFEFGGHLRRVNMTSQVPRLLNLTKEQERRFTRDKNQFAAFLKELEASESGDDGVFKLEAGGEVRWIKITRKSSGCPLRCVVEDVTDEILQTKALMNERDRDGLTGVMNRMAFEKTVERANRNQDSLPAMALVMCDLNDLKCVNDVFGHDKGDEYLRRAADSMRKAFPMGQVFRIGGDEFVVVLHDVCPGEVCQGIRDMECMMVEYSSRSCFAASVAVGAAFYDSQRDRGLEHTLARADRDMYGNKRVMKA